MRAPRRNDECWKAPDSLMPMYMRNEVSIEVSYLYDRVSESFLPAT